MLSQPQDKLEVDSASNAETAMHSSKPPLVRVPSTLRIDIFRRTITRKIGPIVQRIDPIFYRQPPDAGHFNVLASLKYHGLRVAGDR